MRSILLDTHAFLWWVDDAPALSAKARETIAEQESWVSLASAWEIAIKTRLGKLRLALPLRRFFPEQLAANRFLRLDIALAHIGRIESLDLHHRDPFDRLLAAQALEEGLSIVSADPVFEAYGVERIW